MSRKKSFFFSILRIPISCWHFFFPPYPKLHSKRKRYRTGPLQKDFFGLKGETVSREYLKQIGYRIIDQNVLIPNLGEIDLVAQDRHCLVFIEVKSRQSEHGSRPLEAITEQKNAAFVKSTLKYLDFYKLSECQFRFDIVAILSENDTNTKSDVTHYPNVTLQ